MKVDSIKGIEVKSIDWKPLMQDAKPTTDPLAGLIPIDQPAAFFPSVKQAAAVLDAAGKHSMPVLQTIDPQAGVAILQAAIQQSSFVTACATSPPSPTPA